MLSFWPMVRPTQASPCRIFVTEGTVEKQHHLKGLYYMGRLAYGANPAKITRVS